MDSPHAAAWQSGAEKKIATSNKSSRFHLAFDENPPTLDGSKIKAFVQQEQNERATTTVARTSLSQPFFLVCSLF